MANLFSQIPVQVLNKARRGGVPVREPVEEAPKKKVKFYQDKEVRSSEVESLSTTDEDTTSSDILVDDVNSSTNDASSDRVELLMSKECLNAVTQTEKTKMREFGTQTEESLITRPLCSTDNDIQRLNMQSFSPITPMPRRKGGFEPPLRIGLTLRGKKRKVFYPDDDEENKIRPAD